MDLLDEKIELRKQLEKYRIYSIPDLKQIERIKREIEEKKQLIKRLNQEIKLLSETLELSQEWTKLLKRESELSEHWHDLRPHFKLQPQYKKKSNIFIAVSIATIIVDLTMMVLFSMNLLSLKIMTY